jgi:hypothetical protein
VPIPTTFVRFVAYSPTRGTFLSAATAGPPRWSRDPGVAASETATTFADKDAWDAFVQEKQFIPPTDVELRQVYPARGLDAETATADDVSVSGLPRWGDA